MPVNDEERLVVAIEARISEFEKRMKRAEGTGTRSFQQLRAGSSRATRQMESDMVRSTTRINQALATTTTQIGSFGKAMIGGLAIGAGVAALEGFRQAAVESTRAILETSDMAKRAGVSFEAFQGLKFAAQQNRVGVDALTDGLKELSLRADEFIKTGQGSAAESFQRLGYDAKTLAEKLKAPDQLFLEIIGKLEKLDKAAQIRIADEVFGGTGGEQFVQLIGRGERGLRDQIKAAEDLGIVMNESMVRKAEEVNQKFDLIATTIGSKLKGAIVDAVSVWSEFLDSYNDFSQQRDSTLQGQQAGLGMQRLELETEKLKIQNGESWNPLYWNKDGPAAKGRIHEIDIEIAKILERERKIADELNRRLDKTEAATVLDPVIAPSSRTPVAGESGLAQYLAPNKDASHISGMSSSFESKLENMLKAMPAELAGQIRINSGYRSTERQAQLWQDALAKYGSVAEARKWVAPPGNSQHNKGNAADLGYTSDAARQWAHGNASRFGLSFPLGNEDWHIEDADARRQANDERTRELEDRGKSYDDIVQKAREFVASQQIEGQALNLNTEAASRLRHETEILNEARQAGLELSPSQIEYFKSLAAEMANAEMQTKSLSTSQEELKRRAEEFGADAKAVVGGFISDLKRGTDASEAFKNALARVGDMLLDSALNGLFGGGGVQGGGLFGQLFSGLLGGIGKNAKGTDNWRGGLTWVGEDGPEIVNAKRGSQIIPNHILKQGRGGSGGSRDVVDVSMAVDKAFISSIAGSEADKRIATASGTIVNVTLKAVGDNIDKINARAQRMGK